MKTDKNPYKSVFSGLVDSAIEDFNQRFPKTIFNVEDYRTKSYAAIDVYTKKLEILSTDTIVQQLKQHLKQNEEILNRGEELVNKHPKGNHEYGVLIGLISTRWIPAMINYIERCAKQHKQPTEINPISILKFLDAHRHKWIVDVSIIKELNIKERDFETAIAILKTKGFIKDDDYSGARKRYMITEAGISFLQESSKAEAQQNQNTFSTFDELFETAWLMESIPSLVNSKQKEAAKDYCLYTFNAWLQRYKGWEIDNKKQYRQLLTKENWKEYLQHEEQLKIEAKNKSEDKKQDWQPQQKDKQQTKKDVKEFVELFERISHFNAVVQLLSAYFDSNTLIWKDKKKGYKSVLICILKNLHLKGYYKSDIDLTNETYIQIAANTFKVKISIDNAKKVDADYIDTSFIPYASTLP